MARALVEKKLAACVNIFPVRSIYFWEDQTQDDDEVMLMIKTTEELKDEVENWIKEIHPYKVPEFLTFRIEGGLEEYLLWVQNTVTSRKEKPSG